jgi:hypothetical protein
MKKAMERGLMAAALMMASGMAVAADHVCDGTCISGLTPILTPPSAGRQTAQVAPWEEFADAPLTPFSAEVVMPCFDPTHPPTEQVMAAVNAYIANVSARYQLGGTWAPAPNTPVALTWSFVPDTVFIPAAGFGDPGQNSRLFARMDSLFSNNRTLWIGLFQRVFDRWAELSGLSYTRVRSGANDWDAGAAWGTGGNDTTIGDVRISAKTIDGGSGILAYNSFPGDSDMVMDADEFWNDNFRDYNFLRNVATHEHGHGLGFSHVCPYNRNKLMEPFYDSLYDGPQQDDIRAVQRAYGDAYEPNNIGGSGATALGSLAELGIIAIGNVPSASGSAPAPPNASLCSIGASSDSDWYKFSVTTPRVINVKVDPIGTTYGDNAQNSNCTQTGTTNALIQGDLAIQVYSGSTLIAQASAAASGATEQVSSLLISPPGEFQVRVYVTNASTQSQLYRPTITSLSTPTMSATDGTYPDKVRLSWTAIPNAVGYRVLRAIRTQTNPDFANTIATLGYDGSNPPEVYEDTTGGNNTVYNYWIKVGFNNVSGGGTRDQVGMGPDTGFRQASTCPTITDQPDSIARCTGAEAQFTVAMNNPTGVSYQWQKDTIDISGATLATYTIPSVTPDDDANYRCVITGPSTCSITSDAATLTVNENVAISDQPDAVTVNTGEPASFTVVATGTSPAYQWQKDGSDISGATGATYNIAAATLDDAGEYRVVVSNSCGSLPSDAVLLTVNCAADFNGDQTVDFFDYLDFAQSFANEEESADFNGDNQVDFFDYLDFVQAFEQPC